MAQQPLPSMFDPSPPGYVDPPIVYLEFMSFLMERPTMCEAPDVDDEQEESVEEIHAPEDLAEAEVLYPFTDTELNIEDVCHLYLQPGS